MADRSTKKSLERFKYEVADELGVPLSNGYNGDLTAKQNGSVGGYMVKKNDRSTGKTDGWQRRKHPVTHLSQCTKEKSRSLSRRPAFSFAGIYKFIFESCSS